ncbi:unnamed protein product, partial [Prorocentrum cordatum]
AQQDMPIPPEPPLLAPPSTPGAEEISSKLSVVRPVWPGASPAAEGDDILRRLGEEAGASWLGEGVGGNLDEPSSDADMLGELLSSIADQAPDSAFVEQRREALDSASGTERYPQSHAGLRALGSDAVDSDEEEDAPEHACGTSASPRNTQEAQLQQLREAGLVASCHRAGPAAPGEAVAAALAQPGHAGAAPTGASEPALENSAWWEEHEPKVQESVEVLAPYGYRASGPECWLLPPDRCGLELSLQVQGHEERDSHTWYLLECSLTSDQQGGGRTDWQVARRLWHLRTWLYERIKLRLGAAYVELFVDVPFARRGGVSGTTERLQAWLAHLACLINAGRVPPSAAALALTFLQAPEKAGTRAEDGSAALERSPLALRSGELSQRSANGLHTARSLVSRLFAGGAASSEVPAHLVGRSLLDADISSLTATWVKAVSRKLSTDGVEITKVGRNASPYKRLLRVEPTTMLLVLEAGGRLGVGSSGTPLDDLIDISTGLGSREFAKFCQNYTNVIVVEEMMKRACVLKTAGRTLSLLFETEAKRDTVNLFLVCLLKSKSHVATAGGTEDILDSTVRSDRPREGSAKVVQHNSSVYEGEFKNYLRHGNGVLTLADGTRFESEWHNDRRHGAGAEYCPDGTVFKGHYLRGLRHGQGTMIWPGGAEYVGQFANGRAEGTGTLKRVDGTVYSGQFSDDSIGRRKNRAWGHGVDGRRLPLRGPVQSEPPRWAGHDALELRPVAQLRGRVARRPAPRPGHARRRPRRPLRRHLPGGAARELARGALRGRCGHRGRGGPRGGRAG